MGSQYIDVVIFALVAVFIGLRLRSVLGRRTGNERPPRQFGPMNGSAGGPVNGGTVTPLRRGNGNYAPPVIEGKAVPVGGGGPGTELASIQAVDPSITPESFLAGARGAFAMVLRAFAQGDENALRPLLSDEVFENFARVIRGRRDAGEVCSNQLVDLVSAEIVEAEMAGRDAHVTVRFVSQQVIAVKDAHGAVVEGDPSKTVQVTDLWTFARDPRSRDPNWTLIATRSQDE